MDTPTLNAFDYGSLLSYERERMYVEWCSNIHLCGLAWCKLLAMFWMSYRICLWPCYTVLVVCLMQDQPLVLPVYGPWCIAWMSWGCWSSCLADFAAVLHGWLNVVDIVQVVAGIGCGYVIAGQWILFMAVQCSWHNPEWLVCIIYVGCGVCMLILLMDIAYQTWHC